MKMLVRHVKDGLSIGRGIVDVDATHDDICLRMGWPHVVDMRLDREAVLELLPFLTEWVETGKPEACNAGVQTHC